MYGLVRELNPGPLTPEARMIPLDQRATDSENYMSISEFGQMISRGATSSEQLFSLNSMPPTYNIHSSFGLP